jgi:hypothetical protein
MAACGAAPREQVPDAGPIDAVTLDPPRSDGRMSGTVIATAPGWMLDFYVELPFVQVSSNHGGCTI